MFGFSIFNLAVAVSKDLQTLLITRFFCGIFGSCPLAVVAPVYTDIFDNKQRGPAVTIFAATVFMGPMLGPFIGGFIVTSYLGWRWTAYISSIMGWLSLGLIVLFMHESYPPTVLVAKAAELRRRTKNWGIHAKQEEVEVDLRELVTKNFSRPIRLLFTEPVILLITIYMSFIYGLLYLFLTAYPLVFRGVHGMSAGVGGLPFFGMVAGLLIVATYIIWSAKGYNKKLAANGGVPVPEWRLPPVIIGGALFAVGLFWFGWTGYTRNIHWIVPTLSGLLTGFGLLAIFIQLFNYIIDSYLMLYVAPHFFCSKFVLTSFSAASALAGNTFLRSITAAGFPLFARQMFNGMGIQYAGTLLGCVAILLIPIPVCFYLYGKKLRERSKYSPTMGDKPPLDEESETDEEEQDQAGEELGPTSITTTNGPGAEVEKKA
jgi:MFS transporter, DHA1 family, multidrug resistance protein